MLSLASVGCSSASGVEANENPGGGAGGAGGAAGAGGSGAGAAAGEGGAGGGVNIGGENGGGSGPEGPFDGCHNVDVLFVIDDSGSMGDKQDALIKAFPGFVSTMKEKLAKAVSYHVGVVTSDYYEVNPPGCEEIGSLVTKTRNGLAPPTDCNPLPGNKRYLDGGDPDLSKHFQCIAKVGPFGDDNERLMKGLLNATDPKLTGAGTCNEGFLRADSLLIIVMIADEDDAADEGCDPFAGSCMTGSGGDSTEWFNTLVKNRGGVADNIVALGLFNEDKSCSGSIGARTKGFTKKFKHSAVGNVCSLDYAKFFEDALPSIGAACAEYTPIK